MRLRLVVLLACVIGMLTVAGPLQAVIGGQPDPDRDYVAFIRYKESPTAPSLVCSAVAVDRYHLVTAAHCAPDGATVKVLFDDVVLAGSGAFDGKKALSGTFHAIPGSCFGCPPEGQPDLAVIALDKRASIKTFATLSTTAPSRKTVFTLSGYGVDDAKTLTGAGTRRSGDVELIPSNNSDSYLKVSSSQVGACYGDSGGYVGVGDVLYAVVSSGTPMCGGTGDVYKVYSAEARAFLSQFGL